MYCVAVKIQSFATTSNQRQTMTMNGIFVTLYDTHFMYIHNINRPVLLQMANQITFPQALLSDEYPASRVLTFIQRTCSEHLSMTTASVFYARQHGDQPKIRGICVRSVEVLASPDTTAPMTHRLASVPLLCYMSLELYSVVTWRFSRVSVAVH